MTYYLRSPFSNYSPLMVSCSYKSQQIQFSTGLNVKVKAWDDVKKRLRQSKDTMFNIKFNAQLSNWREDVDTCLIECKLKKLTYLETKKKVISIFRELEKDKTEFTLIEFFEDARLNWGKPMPKNFKTFENKFEAYLKKAKKTKASYNDVDLTLLNGFRKYLYSLDNVESTVQKRFQSLFSVMEFGLNNGYHSHSKYHPKSFTFSVNKSRKAKANKFIYLRPDEYAKIKDIDFGQAYGVAASADRLILECETGLRYSDMNELKESNVREIEGKLHIQTATMKTAGNYSEPMSSEVLRIYKKYDNGFPKRITNQVFNRHLKTIGELLEMNDYEHYFEEVNGNKERIEKKRSELLTTHSGRRTYATHQYMNGEDLKIISIKMGHSSTAMTETYIHSDAYGVRMRRSNLRL